MLYTTAEKRQVLRLRRGAAEVSSARMWCRISGSLMPQISRQRGGLMFKGQ